jgi:hypothetical protein
MPPTGTPAASLARSPARCAADSLQLLRSRRTPVGAVGRDTAADAASGRGSAASLSPSSLPSLLSSSSLLVPEQEPTMSLPMQPPSRAPSELPAPAASRLSPWSWPWPPRAQRLLWLPSSSSDDPGPLLPSASRPASAKCMKCAPTRKCHAPRQANVRYVPMPGAWSLQLRHPRSLGQPAGCAKPSCAQ